MKGWLIWAYDVTGDQYLRCATALASSIKATQRTNKEVAVVVNQTVKLSTAQQKLFDHIIPIHTNYPAEIMSLGYELSPFQETISLESDTLVCSDMSHWWNALGQMDVLFPGRVLDVRGQAITNSYYRTGFEKHGLANIWSGMFYWQKSNLASDVFKSAKAVCEHWREEGMPFEWTERAANDEFFGKVLSSSQYRQCIDTTGFFTFTHNRPRDQHQYVAGQELSAMDLNITPAGQVWVGPWRQTGVLHYHEKHWMSNDVEETLLGWLND